MTQLPIFKIKYFDSFVTKCLSKIVVFFFEHLPRMEYHQKEDVLDSQASSFPTLYLDGATLLFQFSNFLRKHGIGLVDICHPPFFLWACSQALLQCYYILYCYRFHEGFCLLNAKNFVFLNLFLYFLVTYEAFSWYYFVFYIIFFRYMFFFVK